MTNPQDEVTVQRQLRRQLLQHYDEFEAELIAWRNFARHGEWYDIVQEFDKLRDEFASLQTLVALIPTAIDIDRVGREEPDLEAQDPQETPALVRHVQAAGAPVPRDRSEDDSRTRDPAYSPTSTQETMTIRTDDGPDGQIVFSHHLGAWVDTATHYAVPDAIINAAFHDAKHGHKNDQIPQARNAREALALYWSVEDFDDAFEVVWVEAPFPFWEAVSVSKKPAP